jgi:hypothetical protein
MNRFAFGLAWLVSTIPLTAAAQQIEMRHPASRGARRGVRDRERCGYARLSLPNAHRFAA